MAPQMDTSASKSAKKVLGSPGNFWLWSQEDGFDLTHPVDVESPPLSQPLRLQCHISNVILDPAKTALIIIDLQNFVLHKALRGEPSLDAVAAEEAILKYGIPAARKAKIQVIWLNWGLTDEDLERMPLSTLRTFSYSANSNRSDYGITFLDKLTASAQDFVSCGEQPRSKAFGEDMGEVTLDNGSVVGAGRSLFRGTWNAQLHDPLAEAFEQSQSSPQPDRYFHKNRNAGMSTDSDECTEFLKEKGIKTLLFVGTNTDQCVLGTLFNAQTKGYDTIMLNDGCVTDSPGFAQQSSEWQCSRNWGFLSSCKAFHAAASSY